MTTGYQKDQLRSIFWMVGFLRLPNVLSSYAICITVQLWLFRLSWPRLEGSLAIRKILPRESTFIKACARGDLVEVRQLALSGQGTPCCIDETGTPALHVIIHQSVRLHNTDGRQHAISSESLALVKFLLDNGATPDDLETWRYV